jgi:hypothetical protein
MPFDEEELDPHGECRAEIERLRADFLYYAYHKADCRGGDGERCACGYLDVLAGHQQRRGN